MKKKTINEKTNSIILFLMQSYGDSKQIPRKTPDSSLTCMDKHQTFGQMGEKPSYYCPELLMKMYEVKWSRRTRGGTGVV
jgi:hypothetical protein